MASLVLGAAGAVVGSFLLPGLGASIGWTIGAALGNMLFQKGQQGPRLTDLKIQNSSYGQMHPLLWGTMRVAGNVIWTQGELTEHAHKSGGKGGPEITSYTYTASFAIAICGNEILGLKRMWADGRLIYSTATGVNLTSLPFVLYLGDEEQLPDPTIESIEGAGNVNANRGVAYIVFTDLLLTDYGNRIPSFTFEVFTHAGTIPYRVSTWAPPHSNSSPSDAQAFITGASMDNLGGVDVGLYDSPNTTVTRYTLNRFTIDGDPLDTPIDLTFDNHQATEGTYYQASNDSGIGFFSCGHIGETGDVSAWYVDGAFVIAPVVDPIGGHNAHAVYNWGVVNAAHDAYYAPGGGGGIGAYIAKYTLTNRIIAASPSDIFLFGAASGAQISVTIDDVTGKIYVGCDATMGATYASTFNQFDADLNLLHTWQKTDLPHQFQNWTGVYQIIVWNDLLCFSGVSDTTFDRNAIVYRIVGTSFEFVGEIPVEVGNYLSLGGGLVMTPDGIISLNPPPGPVLLKEIVADLSFRSGLTAGEIDVDALTDPVDGYVVSQQATTRAMIDPLQTAYFFDAVESDAQAKFVKRGRVPDATIPEDDLGAFDVEGGSAPVDAQPHRIQEVDLPRIITADYLNVDADYQNGTQISQRLITSSQKSVSLQLPIAMTDRKGKEIADAILYSSWCERTDVTIEVPRKWAELEPTDVINAGGYSIRVSEKSETPQGVIRLKGVTTLPFVYSHAGVSVPGLAPPQPPPPTAASLLTELRLLDLPLVTDTDFPAGYYAAMAGKVAGSWPGATIYKSVDGGVSYNPLETSVVPDTFGATTTALGNFAGGNTFDETNSVTVVITPGGGTLESATELAVLNGANGCVIGTELVQFKNATLTGVSTYTISGLLRGRRGTEFAMGSHSATDAFCMLPTTVNLNGPFPEIGVEREFKGVTSGQAIAAATEVDFTNEGVALRCYSPVQIGGGLDASGNLTITWTRRTRIGGTWMNSTDVPIGETSEAYVVQIWDATFSSCARVITGITSQSTVYTAAQQVTDFGATQLTIYVTVGQLGTLGLGTQQGAALLGAGATVDAPLAPVTPYGSGPPSPPPGGGCIGTVYNTTLTWAFGTAAPVSSPAGFAPGTNWVLKLTTPGSGNFQGILEFKPASGSAPCSKTMSLSTSACGAPLIPAASQTGLNPVLLFATGTPYFPTAYAHLDFGTDYYFSLQISAPGATEVVLTINVHP